MILCKKIKSLIRKLYIKIRIQKYNLLSNLKPIKGKPIKYQPVLIEGTGNVIFGKNVRFGVNPSPYFYSTYCYINARKNSTVEFGNNIWINNNFYAITEGEGIYIGSNTIMGANCSIIDTDFHHIEPQLRMQTGYSTKKVTIGENVWLGNNVSILKGVSIGKNSVIANGAIVTKSIPDNVVAGGNPCKIIKEIY